MAPSCIIRCAIVFASNGAPVTPSPESLTDAQIAENALPEGS